jgi:hypothetical protein
MAEATIKERQALLRNPPGKWQHRRGKQVSGFGSAKSNQKRLTQSTRPHLSGASLKELHMDQETGNDKATTFDQGIY